MIVLGLSGAVSHDASAALYVDGKLVAAAEEERFLRDKHAKGKMPYEAVRFCLDQAGISPSQIDIVAFPYAEISIKSPARWHYAKRHWYAPDRALTALFSYTITDLGLKLFVIPGVFFAVTLSLAIPLVIEKQMSPFSALALSIKALARKQWFNVFSIYLFLITLLFLSMLPLLIPEIPSPISAVFFLFATFWLAPLFINTKGILYREIFGVLMPSSDQEGTPSSGNIFEA